MPAPASRRGGRNEHRGNALALVILVAAAIAIVIALGDPRAFIRAQNGFLATWVFLIAAWPIIVIYLVGPLIWVSAEQAGPLNPALQYLPAALCSVVAVVRSWRAPAVEISAAAALIGSLYLFAAVAVWFSGLAQLLNFLIAATLFVGVVLKHEITDLRQISLACQLSLMVTILAITLAATVNSAGVLANCRVDKCGVTTVALTSPFAGNGNVLGMATALLVPFACAVLPLWRSIALFAGVGALQLVALSRTAIFAFALVSLALVLMKLVRTPQAQLRVAIGVLLAAFVASVYPLFVTFSGSSFSYRGYVWQAARDSIAQAPVFGHGPSHWFIVAQSALFDANYSPHNGWYDLLVAVGVWGVTIIIVGVTLQLFSTSTRALPYLIVYYACVLAINTLESVYVPYFFGIAPFAALLPLMLYDPKPAKDPELQRNLASLRPSEKSGPHGPT